MKHKTAWLGLQLAPELKERLRDAAEREHRTMSNFVRKTLLEALHEEVSPSTDAD